MTARPAKNWKEFNGLNLRESEILTLRYMEEKSFAQIGRKYNVTRERIRQVVERAVGRMVRAYLKTGQFPLSQSPDSPNP